MDQMPQGGKCGCMHHKMTSIFAVLFGLTFLLGTMSVISDMAVSYIWPIIVILAGLTKMSSNRCKCC